MATQSPNPTLTDTYQLIVSAGDEFLLTLLDDTATVEVVAYSGAPPAALQGHPLWPRRRDAANEGLNRTLLGPGDVYARTTGGTAAIALTSWTP